MIATIPSATLLGVDGRPIAVEVHVSNGLPGFTVVGLPDTSCREARDRVRAALLSSELSWPLRRVTVNLAPSTLRKAGGGLDLPIAVGLLVAGGSVSPAAVEGMAFVGELGLDGTIRRVPGIVPLVDAISAPTVVVPQACRVEACLVGRHRVLGVATLRELFDVLAGQAEWPGQPEAPPAAGPAAGEPDLADVRGQHLGRWALEVAAAGGHHMLLVGPPGAGKTLLARRLAGLLPPLGRSEALETTRVHSAAGLSLPAGGLVERPPFRWPHHGASAVALVGGGSGAMRPGEISLAHNGVLFLDEVAEFRSEVLDSLRQPLEEGVIRVARAKATVTYPAHFLLVAAMNPCPCGSGGPAAACRCSLAAVERYGRRMSGPLLDRFDLRVPLHRPDVAELLGGPPGEGTAPVAARVASAREVARSRGVSANAELSRAQLDRVGSLSAAAVRIVEHRLRRGLLSARGLDRVRRVARTLADLDGVPTVVGEEHVCAALELRADVVPGLLERAS